MDVLSDAVLAMRVGRPHSARTGKHGSWGLHFDAFDGAGFHVVLQGSCWLFPDGGEPVALGVGDVVLLPRGSAHGLADGPTTRLTEARTLTAPESADTAAAPSTVLLCGGYLLDRQRAHPLLAELPEVIHLPARVGGHPSLRAALDLLGAELDETHQGADAIVRALLDTLLLYILRAWLDERAGQAPTGWAAALDDPAVATALGVIHREPAHGWTVQSLAARAGLSRAAFARRFTTLVGSPPLAYLTWWRMTVAAGLLRDTDLPIGAVAGRVGYASEFAFAKAFKRQLGDTPGRYRATAG